MSDMTDRYVGATLRSIPERQRADIEAELRASIDDEIEARAAAGEDAGKAEEEVLSALGDPERLAASYTGRPGYLIGPDLFFDYKRLLAVLLVSVVPIVVVVIGIVRVVGGESLGEIVVDTVGTALTLAVHIAFWTTLVFALVERSDRRPPETEWTLSKLPPVPSAGSIHLSDTIASLVVLSLAIAGLSLSGSASPVMSAEGSSVPFFDPELLSFWLPYFIVILGLEIVFEIVKYRVGRWTWPLASFNLALNASFAIPAVYLLATDQVLNSEFFEILGWGTAPRSGSTSINLAIVAIAGVAIWDVIDGFRKARK